YPIGSKVKGLVVNIVDFGAFVQLEEGIVGLVHVSEMPLVLNNVLPLDILNEDDELEVTVLEISKDSQRISLSTK
ncbi:S1 RNA-binding domain-containing protein, partial [Candidatus Poribacteria bacterium]|nr:S1 RNA-binding domain-containing protein [Candidatus Poribacteria bacterium]